MKKRIEKNIAIVFSLMPCLLFFSLLCTFLLIFLPSFIEAAEEKQDSFFNESAQHTAPSSYDTSKNNNDVKWHTPRGIVLVVNMFKSFFSFNNKANAFNKENQTKTNTRTDSKQKIIDSEIYITDNKDNNINSNKIDQPSGDCREKMARSGFDKKPCEGDECSKFCNTYPKCCPNNNTDNKMNNKQDNKNNEQNNNNNNNNNKDTKQASTEEEKLLPPIIKNIGVNIAPYNSETKKAGDFSFTINVPRRKILGEFGQKVMDVNGGTKSLPHYDYYLPKNTPVMAIANGEVITVWYQKETNDYAIHTKPVYDSYWSVSYDHVTAPLVKENQLIKAGDIIANAGNSAYPLEISIESEKESPGRFYPLFSYFDPSLKEEYEKKVWKLLSDWESYKGNTNIYDESAMKSCPACLDSSLKA